MASSLTSLATSTSSSEFQSRHTSIQPSCPLVETSTAMANELCHNHKEEEEKSKNEVDEDNMEDVNGKAKALTNLLKTSSVSSALGDHRYAFPLMLL